MGWNFLHRTCAVLLLAAHLLCSTSVCAAIDTYYWRPSLHYTTAINWINDPNGLIYDASTGLWHLFAQYNPYSDDTSNYQSWSHSVSRDLMAWTDYPVALLAETSEYMWSGSAVIDARNTSGLCRLPSCLITVYCGWNPSTGRQTINIAASIDAEWKFFEKYSDNPVIDIGSQAFRDPAAFWYSGDGDGRWVVAITHSDVYQIEFWRSTDLIHWTKTGQFTTGSEGNYDCPSLWPIRLEGSEQEYWVLMASYSGTPGYYWIGEFDGNTFRSNDTARTKLLDFGTDNYATITYNDAPNSRRVSLGWLDNWDYASNAPTSPWRGAATLPREIRLVEHNTSDGMAVRYLHSMPAPEVNSYRNRSFQLHQSITVQPGDDGPSILRDVLGFQGGSLYEVAAVVNATCPDYPCSLAFHIRYNEVTRQSLQVGITIDAHDQPFLHFMDRSNSGDQSTGGSYNDRWSVRSPAVPSTTDRRARIDCRIVVDASVVEVFLLDGLIVASYQFFPSPFQSNYGLALEASNGEWTIDELTVWTYNQPRYNADILSSLSNGKARVE